MYLCLVRSLSLSSLLTVGGNKLFSCHGALIGGLRANGEKIKSATNEFTEKLFSILSTLCTSVNQRA